MARSIVIFGALTAGAIATAVSVIAYSSTKPRAPSSVLAAPSVGAAPAFNFQEHEARIKNLERATLARYANQGQPHEVQQAPQPAPGGPADTARREAIETSRKMFSEEVERRVAQEPREAKWALESESATTAAIESHFSTAKIERLSCATTVCAIDTRHQTDGNVQEYLKDVFTHLPPFDEVSYTVDRSDPQNEKVSMRAIRRGVARDLHAEMEAAAGLSPVEPHAPAAPPPAE